MGVFRALVPAEMSLDEPFPASPYPMPVGDAAYVCDGPLARTVLIAKADRIYAAALRTAIESLVPDAEIDCVSRLDEAERQVGQKKYDLIVSGIMLLDGDALDWLASILGAPDSPRVMVVTGRRETRVLAALHESRAHGVFDSCEYGLDELREAIRLVLSGGMFWSGTVRDALLSEACDGPELLRCLTPTEQLVLAVIGDGSDDNEAADRLAMTSVAIRSHRKRLYAKLRINHRGQLIRLALCHGFVRVSGARVVHPGFGLLRSRAPRRGR